jgi:hypothetical protein
MGDAFIRVRFDVGRHPAGRRIVPILAAYPGSANTA